MSKNDALLVQIHDDEYTAADERAVNACWSRFNYTTTFLSVLEVVLRREGDPQAADLVGSITNRMAKHEAESA